MSRPVRPLALILLLALAARPAGAVALVGGDILAVDSNHQRVLVVHANGTKAVAATSLPANMGPAVIGPDGGFYVGVRTVTPGIVRVDPVSGTWSWFSQAGELTYPEQMLLDRDGALLVLDQGGSAPRIVRVEMATGAQSIVVPAGAVGGWMSGFAVRTDGDLFVATAARLARWSRATGQATTLTFTTGPVSGLMLLLPFANTIELVLSSNSLDTSRLAGYDATTGASQSSVFLANHPTAIAPMPDGSVLASFGGTELWRYPPGGVPARITAWNPPESIDPDGSTSYRGIAVVDAATPARAATWGELKVRYR